MKSMMNQNNGIKKILILGGGGFIGGHLAKRLKNEGNYVRVVDIKNHEYFNQKDFCDEFLIYDLTDPKNVSSVMRLEELNGMILLVIVLGSL